MDWCTGVLVCTAGPTADPHVTPPPSPPRTHTLTHPSLSVHVCVCVCVCVQDLKEHVAETWRLLMPHLIKTHPTLYSAGANTQSSLMWSALVVWSRAFGFGGGDETGLVPFVDLANHRARATSDYSWDSKVFELKTESPAAPGDEIEISYGDDKPTISFLLHYGFLTGMTEGDFVTITAIVGRPPGADVAAGTHALPSPSHQVLVQAGPDGFLPRAFLLRCGQAAAAAAAGAANGGPGAGAGAGASADASAVCTGGAFVHVAVAQHIARLPTSINEDEALLREPGLPAAAHTAAATRLRFKRILARVEAMAASSAPSRGGRGCGLEGAGGEGSTPWPAPDKALLVHRLHDPDLLLQGQIARSYSMYNVQVPCYVDALPI